MENSLAELTALGKWQVLCSPENTLTGRCQQQRSQVTQAPKGKLDFRCWSLGWKNVCCFHISLGMHNTLRCHSTSSFEMRYLLDLCHDSERLDLFISAIREFKTGPDTL